MAKNDGVGSMGRRPKRTPEREQAILNALRVGNTRRAACAGAEISEDTFARWMAADAVFCGAVEHAEADAEQRFLGNVSAAAGDTWQAAAWWLERRRYADYRRREGVELTGKDGGPIEGRVDVMAWVPDDTFLARYFRVLKEAGLLDEYEVEDVRLLGPGAGDPEGDAD